MNNYKLFSINGSFLYAFIAIYLVGVAEVAAQKNLDRYLDSLNTVVNSSSVESTLKIQALLGLGYANIGGDTQLATRYLNEALKLSEKLKDSFNIIRSYNRLARFEIYYENDTRAIAYADSALAFSNKNKQEHFAGIGYSYRLKGMAYGYLQKNNLSLECFLKANSFLLMEEQDAEIQSYLAENYIDLASIYEAIEEDETALVSITKALELAKSSGADWEVGEAYHFLASYYVDKGTSENANKYIDSTAVAYEKVSNSVGTFGLQKLRAELKLKEKKYEEAIALYKKCLISDRLDSLAYVLTDDYIFLSKTYMAMNQIEMANIYIDSASVQAKFSENPANVFDVAKQRATIFNKQGKINEAIKVLKNALADSNINQFKESQKQLFKQLYEAYEQTNNSVEAFRFLKKYGHLNDSLQHVIKKNKFNVLRSEFNYNELSAKLEARDAQLKVSEAEQKLAQGRTYFFVGLLIFLALFFVFAYIRQRKLNAIKRENLRAKQEVFAIKQKVLDDEVKFKNKQITDFAIHISEKNDLLESIKAKLKDVKAINNTHKGLVNETIHFINSDIEHNKEKIQLYQQVDQTNDSFRAKLDERYSNLNEKEKKVATLLRLGQTSKQIAFQLGISPASVDNYRYKLRKKMEIQKGESLKEFIKNI